MELLPPEVQLNIAIYTNPADIGRICCVSKTYKAFCEDPDLWKIMNKRYFGGPFVDGRGWRMTLIKNVCELDYLDTINDKVLWVVQKGHYNALRRLLQRDPTMVLQRYINSPVSIGVTWGTLLHSACFHKHVGVARVLLAFGAEIDESDENGITPLHLASESGSSELVQLLLSYNPNVNKCDHKGRAAIHKATYMGRMDTVKLLLKVPDIDIELPEQTYGQTALHIASGRGYGELAQVLIQHKADINALDRDGWSPLHVCCSKGFAQVVAALLSNHAKTDLLISNRWSALSLAEEKGYHDVVNLFNLNNTLQAVN